MQSLFIRIIIYTCLLVMSPFLWAQTSAEDAPHAPMVSIVTLLAEPANKNVQRVQVAGFLVLEFEGQALYMHREDYEQQLTKNAIRVALTSEQEREFKNLSGCYVLLEGSFQKVVNSQDIFTGSIFNVRRIVKMLPRR